jgi:hypothetical protein
VATHNSPREAAQKIGDACGIPLKSQGPGKATVSAIPCKADIATGQHTEVDVG